LQDKIELPSSLCRQVRRHPAKIPYEDGDDSTHEFGAAHFGARAVLLATNDYALVFQLGYLCRSHTQISRQDIPRVLP